MGFVMVTGPPIHATLNGSIQLYPGGESFYDRTTVRSLHPNSDQMLCYYGIVHLSTRIISFHDIRARRPFACAGAQHSKFLVESQLEHPSVMSSTCKFHVVILVEIARFLGSSGGVFPDVEAVRSGKC